MSLCRLVIRAGLLLLSFNSFADIAPPPSPFNGNCYCKLSCATAFVSNDPKISTQTDGNYIIYFSTTATNTILPDNGDALCLAASKTSAPTTSLGLTGSISAQAATIQFCTNGGAQVGACSTASTCTSASLVCGSLINYRN